MHSLPILEFLQDCYEPPLDRAAIERLELELGMEFPNEYIGFLLQFNGGDFHRPVMFYLPAPAEFTSAAAIDSFYGDSGAGPTRNGLAWYAQTYEGRIPDEYLLIAHCNSLDHVMLKLKGPMPEYGTVWFWDGVGEGEGGNIHWLAESFDSFLTMLQVDLDYEEPDYESIPVFQAIEYGNRRAIEEFLAQGGDKESRNAEGLTLLAAATKYSWPKIVQLLVDHSADLNAPDQRGRTPLHHAANHSYDSVKLLVAAGADVKARDHEGRSVLAQWSYRVDQYLRARGAEE
jgi:SMI1-KNR4 cell-wall/Ankyrin repeats (3 copies)